MPASPRASDPGGRGPGPARRRWRCRRRTRAYTTEAGAAGQRRRGCPDRGDRRRPRSRPGPPRPPRAGGRCASRPSTSPRAGACDVVAGGRPPPFSGSVRQPPSGAPPGRADSAVRTEGYARARDRQQRRRRPAAKAATTCHHGGPMYRAAVLASLLAVHAIACFDPGPGSDDLGAASQDVVGGRNAPSGKWPDVVALMFDDVAECTGTLVAPSVVLTADHCRKSFGTVEAIVGTSNLDGQEGERIAVKRQVGYPDGQNSYDVALFILDHPSTRPPRPLATGWTRFEILDGAAVAIVGFGAIDPDGAQYISQLQEAESVITDADCSNDGVGCHTSIRPDGELGAGGDGIDSCKGDSGGPLYLLASYGTFLVGVTSRGYENVTTPVCSQGGIYTRPDRLVEWI